MKKIILLTIAVVALIVVTFGIAFFISRAIVKNSSGSLRVTSPNGGEILKAGVNHDILWEAGAKTDSNIGTVYAQSSVKNQELYVIAQNISLGSEGFGWRVGDALRNSRIITSAVPAGSYKIKVCYNDNGACDLSDEYFKVIE